MIIRQFGSGMFLQDLLDRRCTCVFDLPDEKWPVSGYPAWVVVENADMPMVKMRGYHGGESFWINAGHIALIRPAD